MCAGHGHSIENLIVLKTKLLCQNFWPLKPYQSPWPFFNRCVYFVYETGLKWERNHGCSGDDGVGVMIVFYMRVFRSLRKSINHERHSENRTKPYNFSSINRHVEWNSGVKRSSKCFFLVPAQIYGISWSFPLVLRCSTTAI